MGQSWRRPESEPRLGKLECYVERARNLNPHNIDVVKDWPSCSVFIVFSMKLPSSFRRAESSRNIAVQDGLARPAPIWREKVAEWNDVPYPPTDKVIVTLAYEKDKNTDPVPGGYYGIHSKEWTFQQGVSPLIEPVYAWRGLRSKPSPAPAASSFASAASPSPTRIGHKEYRGEVKVAIRWSQTEPEFRPYIHFLSHYVARTQEQSFLRFFYEYLNPLLASLLDVFIIFFYGELWYKRMLLPAYAFLTKNRSIVLAAVLACFLPLALLWVPALVFLPITLLLFGCSFLLFLCLTPLGCAFVWFLLASEPVQAKLLRPFLQTCLKTKGLRGWVTLPRSPYSP